MSDISLSISAPPAFAEGHPTCLCGQELDMCRHEHCPRCGHRVEHRVAGRVLVGATA